MQFSRVMKLRPILIGLVGVAMALVACAAVQVARPKTIEFQLKLPVTESVAPGLRMAFHHQHSIGFERLPAASTNQDAHSYLFQKAFDLDITDPPKGLVVYRNRGSNDQVFLLWIPINSKAGDWTNWRYPNYAETNASSNLSNDYVPPERTTNIPPNSFQMRYRLVD